MSRLTASSTNYDLVAIDLDGTLLCPRGRVSAENVRAIAAARSAGITVTICTGRGLIECQHINEQIQQRDPVVVAGGAMLACPVRGSTLHRFTMEETLVSEIATCLLGHGHAVLIFKDRDCTAPPDRSSSTGHDYLVVSQRGLAGVDPVTRWWFDEHQIPIHVVRSVEDDQHPAHTLRVGICGTRRATMAAANEIAERFGSRVALHHFAAVAPHLGGTGKPTEPDDEVVILEAFGSKVHKWTAIEWLAAQRGIDHRRIAAIGNDINDLTMLRSAGLGVAMGNSIPEALEAAHRRTLDNTADGVAHALDQIVAGRW